MFERSILIQASPEQVWAIFADFSTWTRWDRDLAAFEASGLHEGGTGTLVMKAGGARGQARFSDVRPGQGFTWEARLMGGLVGSIAHFTLEPRPGGATWLVYRFAMRGLIGRPLNRLAYKTIAHAMEFSVAELQRMAAERD